MNYANVITSLAAVVAGVLGILKYFNYRSKGDELRLIDADFRAVVAALRSDAHIERMAGAISLRRFYDEETQSRKKYMKDAFEKYRKDALDITTAILRGQVTSDFQKVLADGLAFAVNLQRADLQRTNLQFAYLGTRQKGAQSPSSGKVDLSHADFFRADLSSASLKGAHAPGAVFYQARLHKTVLSKADLSRANFFEADLKDAKFDNATLSGADFHGARNIPMEIQKRLDEKGIYQDKEPFRTMQSSSDGPYQVFLSRPGYLSYQRQQQIAPLLERLKGEGIQPMALERCDYPKFGALSELRRMMSGCSGAIILGLPDLLVEKGSWRSGTPEEKAIEGSAIATPWSQIEAGMAVMLGIPILALRDHAVTDGVFEVALGEPGVYEFSVDEDWNATAFLNAFANWCSDVREQGRAAKAS